MGNEGNKARALDDEVTMVEPLRKRRADGTAYYRRPEVEAELQQLAKLTPAEVLERAREGERQGRLSVSSEALVHILRREVRTARAHGPGQGPIDGLTSILCGRCERSVRQHLPTFEGVDREEICAEVLNRVVDEIFDDGDVADYAEINFNSWLARNRIDSFRRRVGKLGHRARLGEALEEMSEGEAEAPITPDALNGQVSTEPTPEAAYALTEALEKVVLPQSIRDGGFSPERLYQIAAVVKRASLPPNVLEAFVLHHYLEMRIESKDPHKHTLVKHFGKSEKTIRLWIGRAEKAFAQLRGENNEPEADATEPGLGAARLPR